MIRLNEKDIWYWYQCIENFNKSGLYLPQYCEQEGIDYRKFVNAHFRIIYIKERHPEKYRERLLLGKKYLSSGELAREFVKDHNITRNHLGEIVTHIRYMDIIERLKQAKEPDGMKFVKVPAIQPRPQADYRGEEAEVIEKQNDIEIIITKGVKVSISPNIDSMKIIKVIELLKDL